MTDRITPSVVNVPVRKIHVNSVFTHLRKKAIKFIPNRIYKHRTRKGIKITHIAQPPVYMILGLFDLHSADVMTEEEFFEYQLTSPNPITNIKLVK